MRLRPAIVALVGATVPLITLGAPGAGAATGPSVEATAVPHSPRELGEVAEYWTRERMRRARPLGLERRPPSAEAGTASRSEASRGRPVLVPPRPPAGSAGAAGRARPDIPFDAHEVPDTTVFPNSTNGKVFVKVQHGLGFCSGTVVSSETRSAVFTAGHCVHNGGRGAGWLDRKWVFVPGYRNGARPFGSFVATDLFTTRGWLRRGNGNYDIGAASVAPNSAGHTVEAAAGARGFAAGQPRGQIFNAFGYPVTHPFGGETLHTCRSAYAGDDRRSRFYAGPLPVRIGCDMTGGSSGGAWVIDGGYLNSVTTHGYLDQPNQLYGPYFGARATWLYNAVRR